MVGRDITPTDMGKHANLIKVAQEEIGTMDVLVCGRCLQVFHFIEEFKQHKAKPCEKETKNIRDSDDSKPKIWAFLLWKSTQMNKEAGSTYPSSWSFYQTWVKMDENLRETWIVAGKTIHSFSRLGQGTLQEMPVKITKTVVNNTDPNSRKKVPAKVTEIEPDKSSVKTGNKLQTFLRKTGSPVKTSPTFSKPVARRAKRTLNGTDDVVDDDVEKVVAKRFNPHRKSYEYLVKWEGRGHECNTWEPTTNLESVPHLLEIFERQLARQKENRAAMQAKQQASGAKDDASKGTGSPSGGAGAAGTEGGSGTGATNDSTKTTPTGSTSDVSTRPVRVSKTKAMDQVKQWVAAGANDNTTSPSSVSGSETVGNGSAANWSGAGASSAKRKLESIDLNDSSGSDMPTTTSTMEDLEEDLIPSHTVKRMKSGNNIVSVESKSPKMNGVAGSRATVSGESLPAGPNSADIILTQNSSATGVVKKPGASGVNSNSTKSEAQIRVLSRGESAVSNSGIVRVANASENASGLEIRSTTVSRGPQLRSNANSGGATNSGITMTVGGANTANSVLGRPTPTNIGNTQITTVPNRQTPPVSSVRPPLGTYIQRKTVQTTLPTQPPQVHRTLPTQTRTTIQPSSGSGRMVLPRIASPAAATASPASTQRTVTKNVTPEQKILQLSKSGDLKVTKKVMTREDPIAQRLNQRQQQQLQQQSQVQIQKVQQVGASSRPTASVSIRKVADSTSQQEEAQSQLGAAHEEQQATQQILQQAGAVQNQVVNQQEQLANQQEQQLQEIDPTLLLTTDSQLLTNEDGTPLLVTGEDGTVYQVAGKNANGQTVLVTTGADGEQQYAYVATADGDDQQMMALDNAVAEAVAQLPADQQNETVALPTSDGQYLVKTTQEDGTTQMLTMTEDELAQHQILAGVAQRQEQQTSGQLCIQTADGEGQEGNIPAEVIQAGLPSPGGTRRVVLLLQDGTFMMTEMHDDEYKSLNITT